MTHDCVGLIGWIFGHAFKARSSGSRYRTKDARGLVDNQSRTYEGDVCVRCGKTRELKQAKEVPFDTTAGSVPVRRSA